MDASDAARNKQTNNVTAFQASWRLVHVLGKRWMLPNDGSFCLRCAAPLFNPHVIPSRARGHSA
jgi:hypothetical protein